MKLASILSIDDDKIVHKFVARALANDFTVLDAFSGEQGIEMAAERLPDIILLDVDMPGMNGYEVCDQLKHMETTKDIPVIFISARADIRDRMQGYEAGGADYIVKPFVDHDLVAKLKVLIDYRNQQQKLLEKIADAEKTAYTAMSGSSELGLVMQFVERSYESSSILTLANHLLDTTMVFGLNCTALITTGNGTEIYSNTGSISPLESELMNLLREHSRFQDFGCRTQVNYNHISLLVKNMPLDNMERYGRIKDLIPALLGACDAKIKALDTEKALLEQTKQVNQSFQSIRETLTQLSDSLAGNQNQGLNVLRHMFNELSQNLPGMGLEDDQENYILDKVEKATHEAMRLVDTGNDISAAFAMVLADLQQLAEEQNLLLDTVINGSKKPDQKAEEEITSVELF